MRHCRSPETDLRETIAIIDGSYDFDPRDMRRRLGWKLRRYRGEHRPWTARNGCRGLFPVDRLCAEVQATAAGRREMHRRSLRRAAPIAESIS